MRHLREPGPPHHAVFPGAARLLGPGGRARGGEVSAPRSEEVSGRFVGVDDVAVEAVPGDGNCLFEVVHRGSQALWGAEAPSSDGKGLRSSVVTCIAAHPGEKLMGLTLAQWLWHERKMTPAEYRREMSKPPSGLNPSSWGGALEMGVVSGGGSVACPQGSAQGIPPGRCPGVDGGS